MRGIKGRRSVNEGGGYKIMKKRGKNQVRGNKTGKGEFER